MFKVFAGIIYTLTVSLDANDADVSNAEDEDYFPDRPPKGRGKGRSKSGTVYSFPRLPFG